MKPSFSLLLVLHAGLALAEDSVAEDVGAHQLERLVELLTPEECDGLLLALSQPEDGVFQQLRRLSPESNDLHLGPRAKRSSGEEEEEEEEECRAALSGWLQTYGRRIYYDRLSRALQHIGRTDVAIEVGKNINQDKVLTLRRYVDDLHKHAAALNIPPIPPAAAGDKPSAQQRIRKREGMLFCGAKLFIRVTPATRGTTFCNRETESLLMKLTDVKDLRLRDLSLTVERVPPPPSQQRRLRTTLPLLHGLLLGFGGNLLLCLLTLLLLKFGGRGRGRRGRQ